VADAVTFSYRIATSTFQTSSRLQTYLLLAVSAVLVMVLTAGGTVVVQAPSGRGCKRGEEHDCGLPLQKRKRRYQRGFLRFALADEIATF